MPQPPSRWPTILTLARLALAPIVAGLILWGDSLVFSDGASAARLPFAWALGLFALAAVSDAVDGALARRLNAATDLGAALDHAADKALSTCALVALAVTGLASDLVVAVILIVARDVAIAGLREGMALSGRALPVTAGGKLKTVAVLAGAGAALAVQTLIYFDAPADWITPIDFLARGAIWAGAALALWSGALYLQRAFTISG
jgi:CDP-diacylglycerol--glycerol-3-phosphate 3-phosphatidyltransferase